MRSSEIRKLMSLAADPSIISFSGGMPNNSLFPIDALDEIYKGLTLQAKQVACQYGPTSGYPPLLKSLKTYLASKGLPIDESQGLLITTGAQQAISLISKVMLDPGDVVVTENPSFIGALAAFKSFGAALHGVALDGDGIDIAALSAMLDRYGEAVKFLYVICNFHNPAGIIYSKERREKLLEIITRRDLCLLEDDPYGELYFDDADKDRTVPLKVMADKTAPICYVGSFAKIFGPGMRLGWLLGPREIVETVELAKQSADACSATFTQVLAHEFLAQNKMPAYLQMVRRAYKKRAGIMLSALERCMPAGVTWTRPRGGFYLWVTMPETINASDVFTAALKNGAAFVIGSAFDPKGQKNNCMRLAFSHTPEEKIEKGIQIIAEAVKSLL
ncbi:MAG: PLP-dependent aminotransferase family protein [Chitinivibrionales bacterium]|nr:PLP-dependent aminotransferase family protein [Chitinivibrionales bacterium]